MKKRLFVAIFALILAGVTLMTSCNVETNGGAADTTTGENPAETTTSGNVEDNKPEYPFVNLLDADLTQYIVLGGYDDLKVAIDVAEVEEALVEELERAAEYYDCYVLITDRVTAKGDRLEISYVGTIDGVAFEGGTANHKNIVLTESTGYIDGFDDDLYGIMPGTTVVTDVTFPEDYHSSDYAGKAAQFTITVHGIVGEYGFTDENVSRLTSDEYKTVEEFTQHFRELLIVDNLNNHENNVKSAIIKALKEASTVKLIPEAQVNFYYYDTIYYYESYYEQAKSYLSYYYGIDSYEEFLNYYGVSEELTMDNAKLSALEDVLLLSLAKAQGMTLSDSEYTEGLTKCAQDWGYSTTDALLEELGEVYIRTNLIKDKALSYLLENTEVTSNYDDYKHLLEENDESEG